jgi:hypothetical protein
MTVRTVAGRDITPMLGPDLKPGMVIAEGIVLAVRPMGTYEPGWWVDVPTAVVDVMPGDVLGVIARVDADTLTRAIEARAAARVVYRCPEGCGLVATVEDDPATWAYGHDCEPVDEPEATS